MGVLAPKSTAEPSASAGPLRNLPTITFIKRSRRTKTCYSGSTYMIARTSPVTLAKLSGVSGEMRLHLGNSRPGCSGPHISALGLQIRAAWGLRTAKTNGRTSAEKRRRTPGRRATPEQGA